MVTLTLHWNYDIISLLGPASNPTEHLNSCVETLLLHFGMYLVKPK